MQMTTHNSLHIRKGYFREEYSYSQIVWRNKHFIEIILHVYSEILKKKQQFKSDHRSNCLIKKTQIPSRNNTVIFLLCYIA